MAIYKKVYILINIWIILEHRSVEKRIKKIAREILARYMVWKGVVESEGPDGLLRMNGFRDKALKGVWKGHRSSRLGLKWRVIYRIDKGVLRVYVLELIADKY